MKKTIFILVCIATAASMQSANEQDQPLGECLQVIKESSDDSKAKQEINDCSVNRTVIYKQFFYMSELPEVKKKSRELNLLSSAYHYFIKDKIDGINKSIPIIEKIADEWHSHHDHIRRYNMQLKTSKFKSSVQYLCSRNYNPNPCTNKLKKCYDTAMRIGIPYNKCKHSQKCSEVKCFRYELMQAAIAFAKEENRTTKCHK